MENLGGKITKARNDRGLSRRELLERAGLGSSPPSRLANYESGLREPTLADLERLAVAMGLTLFQLLEYGDPNGHVVLDPQRRGALAVWDRMDADEQRLWLQRGKKILESRDSDDGPGKPADGGRERLSGQKT